MALTAAKRKNLEAKLAIIEKAMGAGSVMLMDSAMKVQDIDVVPTGSLALDAAIGVGGWPRGRIVETYGPESSGKSTLCLQAVAEAQRMDLVAAYVDAEHALDMGYAKRLGVDVGALIISQPDNGEQALDIVDGLVRSGSVDLIVVDSVAALVPKAELEGAMDKAHMGLQARMMSKALRKLTAITAKNNVLVMFINQIRMKIGVMFGNPETTTGGNALKFYASVRVDIRRIGAVKRGEANVGNRLRAKVVKNKVAPPFNEAEFSLIFGEGIDSNSELIEMGEKYGVVQKTGAWFAFNGERIGQGRANAAEFLNTHSDVAASAKALLLKAMAAHVAPVAVEDAPAEVEGDDAEGEEK